MTLPSDPSDLRLLLHAHADGELDAATALALERRLAADHALAEEHQRIVALKGVIAARLRLDATPDALRARIASLARPEAAAPPRASRRDWGRLAAAALVGAALTAGGASLLRRPSESDALLEAMVMNHRRALLAASPVDVASSDRHTVRPWFENRLALATPAVDLADKGFPLVGGRVDMARGNPVATLAFRAGEHLISLTVLSADAPSSDSGALQRLSLAGFNAWKWRDGARAYWAVSDVEPAQLAAFVAAFRASNAAS